MICIKDYLLPIEELLVRNHQRIAKLVEILKHNSPEQTYQALKILATQIPLHLPPQIPDAIEAAVLVPIILHPTEPTLLLTKRTAHLKHHPSQISFPGGALHEEDKTLKDCALREVEEEIGLLQNQIEIIGSLGKWPSYSGYSVTPYIGLIKPPVNLTPCEHEVEEIFEVPLAIAFDLNNYQQIFKESPVPHHYYEMHFQNKRIWGFTAGLMVLIAYYCNYT